jgi:hypothetical protein
MLAGALLGMVAGSADATTLVAVWSPGGTVIGADSLIHTLDDDKRWSKCKIRRATPVVWAATGITGNPDFHFSLDRIVGEAMSGPGSLDAKIAAFEAALTAPLSEVVHAIRVDNPAWYARYAKGLAVTRLIFSAWEGGVNRFWMREFVATSARIGDEIDMSVRKTDCPGPACHDFRVFMLGNYDYASRIAKEAGFWEKNGVAEGVRQSIQAEIAANPEHVGPPIAIAEVTDDGVRWIERGECGEK